MINHVNLLKPTESTMQSPDRFWFNIRHKGFDNDNPDCGRVQTNVESEVGRTIFSKVLNPIWMLMHNE